MTRILILILLGLTCCTGDKKDATDSEKNSATDNGFMKFVSLLPKLKLPFEVNCEKCCDHPQIDYENELVKNSVPEGSTIVGLIEKTNDRVIILVTYPADMIVPSVKVYDLKGRLVGQRDFMSSYCGGDIDYYGKQFLRISPDMSFTSIDTSYYLERDTIEYRVMDRTKIEITTNEFIINNK